MSLCGRRRPALIAARADKRAGVADDPVAKLTREARPPTPGTGALAFCGPDGRPLHPERVYQAFRRALIRHKLPAIPLHGLRHTWATIALQTGIHPRVVQERLGHSNIAITLQTYSHVLPTMHDDAATSVAAVFMPGS